MRGRQKTDTETETEMAIHAYMQSNLVAVPSLSPPTNSGANAFKGDELSEAANNRLTKL